MSFLDRSNIGNAKVAGMDSTLKMSPSDYRWLLTIFYIAYIVFEWFALMWKVVPPHVWAALCKSMHAPASGRIYLHLQVSLSGA